MHTWLHERGIHIESVGGGGVARGRRLVGEGADLLDEADAGLVGAG
jgi:hypothetical protein